MSKPSGSRRPARRPIVALLLVAIALAALAGVLGVDLLIGERTVEGVLVDVQARSIVYAESLTVRDDGGTNWTFQVSPEVATNREEPQSASHLRQHMMLAERVRVRYRSTPEALIAIRVHDSEEGR